MVLAAVLMLGPAAIDLSRAQGQAAQPAPAAAPTTPADAAPEPLSEQELEVLVARIALYPDELVAVISAASLYPLQIVEAQRFLDARQKDSKLQPKTSWDDSVIALLNYPQIVKMMSDDLDWTQQLGDALANQQKDVLVAIQQLRDQAVATGIIKSDDKVKVTTENDNVIIQAANPEKIYIPQYPPEMLYEPGYAPAPVTYYADPYPSYFWPTATFFTAAVTGAIWAATVDWNDWGVWGGRWRGDADFDCNNCFNNRNFNGRVNIKDVDWRNVDRSKLNFDRNQLNKIDRTNIRKGLEGDRGNNLKNKAGDIRRNNPGGGQRPGGGPGPVGDVRKSTLDGLKAGGGNRPGGGGPGGGAGIAQRPNVGDRPGGGDRPGAGQINRPSGGQANRPAGGQVNRPAGGQGNRPGGGQVNRPSGAPKPGGRVDNRPRTPSGLGEVRSGRSAQMHSSRGAAVRGGGQRAMPPRGMGGGGGRGGGGGHRGGGRR
ncbi:DUF3300 domain-containing protein [Ancylobacter sp. Lp-2]|uniref:DUF3300 domain-containing protein n=1 Tax=Ancylobacter sp. Lp-2 TaxID=2881339 RepID=UPI001E359070|nr:DUF3300 domain-containing protein [Ancylobacter sp. Lp-2]MCB4769688.1 DUF3300 domain-containing protein [Ancylobacter sp. Lp-2]